MANLLTASEAATVLRCEVTDADMLALLPLVDEYIKSASGHDWASDSTVDPRAKAAARMLLVLWHENPGMVGSDSALGFGLRAALSQLEAKAGQFYEFYGLTGAGSIVIPGICYQDRIESVEGIAGVSGDQSASFESVVSADGILSQVSTSDLSSNVYRARIVRIEEL